jgi:hypothetical protein
LLRRQVQMFVKKLCITQLEGLYFEFIQQNWLSLSCCRGTK